MHEALRHGDFGRDKSGRGGWGGGKRRQPQLVEHDRGEKRLLHSKLSSLSFCLVRVLVRDKD